MCPQTLWNLFLIGLVLIFGFYWLMRQKDRASESFYVLSAFLESPQVTNHFTGFSFYLSGYYHGRRFGWNYNVFHEENQLQVYMEPKCDIQLKTFLLNYPRPTASTYVRGKRIFFSMRSLKGTFLESLRSLDPVPLLSQEDAKRILDELIRASEIVEKDLKYQ